jgi:hypothetical protein
MSKHKWRRVGHIGNYYGGLFVAEKDGKFYWMIENWDRPPAEIDPAGQDEIPADLYQSLRNYKPKRKR